MDTKSRSVKPALAFLAFVLGVTLLVYSAAAAVIVTVASGGSFYIPGATYSGPTTRLRTAFTAL